jgi:hypothetical protein
VASATAPGRTSRTRPGLRHRQRSAQPSPLPTARAHGSRSAEGPLHETRVGLHPPLPLRACYTRRARVGISVRRRLTSGDPTRARTRSLPLRLLIICPHARSGGRALTPSPPRAAGGAVLLTAHRLALASHPLARVWGWTRRAHITEGVGPIVVWPSRTRHSYYEGPGPLASRTTRASTFPRISLTSEHSACPAFGVPRACTQPPRACPEGFPSTASTECHLDLLCCAGREGARRGRRRHGGYRSPGLLTHRVAPCLWTTASALPLSPWVGGGTTGSSPGPRDCDDVGRQADAPHIPGAHIRLIGFIGDRGYHTRVHLHRPSVRLCAHPPCGEDSLPLADWTMGGGVAPRDRAVLHRPVCPSSRSPPPSRRPAPPGAPCPST